MSGAPEPESSVDLARADFDEYMRGARFPPMGPDHRIWMAFEAGHRKATKHQAAESERLRSALHDDQTGMALAIQEMIALAQARMWIVEGRGSYEWDDERYRREAGHALREIIEYGQKALAASGDLAHGEDGCRTTRKWVPIAEVQRVVAEVLPPPTIDLMAALKASLEAARKGKP